jgi:NADH:ubiquinone oxidoreductase subunit 6 (subunit J)
MTMYYLMQPYNGDFMVKNHVYTLFNLFSGFFTIVLIFIPVNAMILTAVMVVIAVPYVLVSGLLVRKFAPKTFRVK